jgi:CHAT domain-containing protein
LKAAAPEKLSRDKLVATLESRDWNVVHFAGHSFAREEGDKESRGYIFVGGLGSPEAVDIEEIAPLLRNSTMVYLSSCESSSPAFAIELARRGVPIVIGFRWKVDDKFAALHAHLFYRYLFRERNVETAFLQTRRAIHRRYSTRDRVWASSVLLFGR